jgi:hypothetical protein
MQPILAIVTDTDDPEALGRVQVSSPAMGDYWPAWSPVLEVFGGAGASPAIGDEVVIAFLQGDPTLPVVLGRLRQTV